MHTRLLEIIDDYGDDVNALISRLISSEVTGDYSTDLIMKLILQCILNASTDEHTIKDKAKLVEWLLETNFTATVALIKEKQPFSSEFIELCVLLDMKDQCEMFLSSNNIREQSDCIRALTVHRPKWIYSVLREPTPSVLQVLYKLPVDDQWTSLVTFEWLAKAKSRSLYKIACRYSPLARKFQDQMLQQQNGDKMSIDYYLLHLVDCEQLVREAFIDINKLYPSNVMLKYIQHLEHYLRKAKSILIEDNVRAELTHQLKTIIACADDNVGDRAIKQWCDRCLNLLNPREHQNCDLKPRQNNSLDEVADNDLDTYPSAPPKPKWTFKQKLKRLLYDYDHDSDLDCY
ncbi:hypothetical protein GJ496_005090 [Pomphorhynchus laevis]|nr:hypothetical protein GJ496_005090 [Pomphorhynchus laevis]